MTDFKGLKVVELRAELSQRSLSTSGRRDELIERLEEYEFQHAPVQDDSQNGEPSDMKPPSPPPSDKEPDDMKPFNALADATQPKTPIPVDAPQSELQLMQQREARFGESVSARVAELAEEQKRQARAARFGLTPAETAKTDVAVALKRLDHALSDRRSFHNHGDSARV